MSITTPRQPVHWDLYDANPQEGYAQLRAMCPVARTEEFGGVWGLFRYDDIVAAAKDHKTFSNANPRHPGMPRPPLEVDPPIHTAVRKTMQPMFGKKYMTALEPGVREKVIGFLEPILERGEGNMTKEIYYPLPVATILKFLRLPDEMLPHLVKWSQDIFNTGYNRNPEEHEKAVKALKDYADSVIAERRANPRDPEEDIISRILASDVDGEPMSDPMASAILHLLLTAGHETTTLSLGIVTHYLANHPDVQSRLREQPELIPMAIEEILRYESPVRHMPRTVTRDVEIHGRQLKAGDKVFLVWSSGNRDESAFPDADQVNLDRDARGKSLVFGYGIHKCIGAPIARLQLRVAMEELLARTRFFQLKEPVERTGYPHFGYGTLILQMET
jgi:cytochrome P450